jgi:hypothetical protein
MISINIYAHTNAFRKRGVGMKLWEDVTGLTRTYTSDMLTSLEDAYRFEQALGGPVSGGQISIDLFRGCVDLDRTLSTSVPYHIIV